jgi:hypothetical protein
MAKADHKALKVGDKVLIEAEIKAVDENGAATVEVVSPEGNAQPLRLSAESLKHE